MENRGDKKGIKISRNKNIKTLLFADNQFILADSEDALQISVHKLLTVTNKRELTISTNKAKTMTCKERDSVSTNVVINNTILFLSFRLAQQPPVGHGLLIHEIY
jgi:hypothetical protein